MILDWGYLLILPAGGSLVGWLLAAFQVSWFIWSVTFVVVLYLIRSGTAAIALASSWVTGVISVATVTKAWVPVWNARLPYEHAQFWALGLLLVWAGAIGCVALLAGAAQVVTRTLGWDGKWAVYPVATVMWTAMAGGAWLY